MTNKKSKLEVKNTLKPKDVLEYLTENPDFISNNTDLFNKMFSLSKKNENLVTFENIRIKSLMNENYLLKSRLKDVINTANNNKKIQEKLSRLSNEVISFRKIKLLVNYIEEFIDKEFSSLKVDLNLIKLNGFYELDPKYFSSNLDLINEIYLEKKPKIINKQEMKKYSLEKFSVNKVNSLVICPLGIEYPIGILLVQYKSEMMSADLKFDLLNSLAETISHSLEQFIQK